jgi:hypothetical protein
VAAKLLQSNTTPLSFALTHFAVCQGPTQALLAEASSCQDAGHQLVEAPWHSNFLFATGPGKELQEPAKTPNSIVLS